MLTRAEGDVFESVDALFTYYEPPAGVGKFAHDVIANDFTSGFWVCRKYRFCIKAEKLLDKNPGNESTFA